MGQIILQVVIVLGIIIAGGFLIFFLGDLLMSIVDPKREAEKVKDKKKKEVDKFAQKFEQAPESVQEEAMKNPAVAEVMAEAKKQEEVQPVQEEVVGEQYVPEELTDKENEEQERIAEARAALEKRKEEILKRIQSQLDEDEIEESDEEAEEESEEEVEEEVQETVEESEEQKQLREELEEAKKALEEEKAKYAELVQQIEEAKESGAEQIVVGPTLPKEEYLKQRAELQERLSANEKELRACKKEYLPLAKVNKTLANDEKKLRRKEAIVAKQKVMLYGVNNYADIDEEKAKKLAEELDLLDGLKLSVQHCHEVMENNKERFPVLEKMYYILKAQNEQIKTDILEVEQALASFEESDAE